MLYARQGSVNVRACRGQKNIVCPNCSNPVTSKCGEIKQWHFSHYTKDCDSWSEGETSWHIGWKEHAEPDNVEVRIKNHRADVISPSGHVIELQHSPLDVRDIREREIFYKQMYWLWDVRDCSQNISLRGQSSPAYRSFRWKWPRKSIVLGCTKPIFLDLGEGYIFQPVKVYIDQKVSGYGYLRDYEWFRNNILLKEWPLLVFQPRRMQ